MSAVTPTRRPGVLAVHSIHHFVFSVPDLDVAARFYAAFGLDVQRTGDRLALRTVGHPHVWATVVQGGDSKKLQYVSYGILRTTKPISA